MLLLHAHGLRAAEEHTGRSCIRYPTNPGVASDEHPTRPANGQSTLPRVNDEPASQEPTAVAEVSDALLRQTTNRGARQSSLPGESGLMRRALSAASVPVRKQAAKPGTPLRAVFLLSHVDDRMSVAEIARTARIPVAEALESFTLLVEREIVIVRGGGS